MNINSKQYIKQLTELVGRFRDIRFTGQVVFAAMLLLVSWSSIKTIQTNYVLQKQIATLRQQNAVAELETKNAALQNEYFKTDTYLELSARRNYGLAMPGETVMLVPRSVAYAYAPELQNAENDTDKLAAKPSNFQSWINFFLNRPQQ